MYKKFKKRLKRSKKRQKQRQKELFEQKKWGGQQEMRNFAEKQYEQQNTKFERLDENSNKAPTLLLAAIKGILAVAGAMLLIAFVIWATTVSGK